MTEESKLGLHGLSWGSVWDDCHGTGALDLLW